MNNKAIGLFDSGVGGLTVLKALKAELPRENYIYLGDTARLPYGTKSHETIIRYALQCTEKLVQNDLKMLVVACNTVSSVALPSIKEKYPHIEIIGVVEPGAEAACQSTKNNHIAVLGTESTIKGKAYNKAILSLNPHAVISAKACPLFVGMAEEGILQGHLAEEMAKYYLKDILKQEHIPDTIVLGCTHFPLLKQAIQNVVGEHIRLVDSAQTTARKVKQFLTENNALADHAQGSMIFLTTDDIAKFKAVGELFLGISLDSCKVELVDL